MSDSLFTVTAAQFAQLLKQKYPQRACVADGLLIQLFTQKNPMYRVTYEGTTPVSVSWERSATTPVIGAEQTAAASVVANPPAPLPTDEIGEPSDVAAPPAADPNSVSTSTTEPVAASAKEGVTETNSKAGMKSDTTLTKPCIVCGQPSLMRRSFCLECGASQNQDNEALPAGTHQGAPYEPIRPSDLSGYPNPATCYTSREKCAQPDTLPSASTPVTTRHVSTVNVKPTRKSIWKSCAVVSLLVIAATFVINEKVEQNQLQKTINSDVDHYQQGIGSQGTGKVPETAAPTPAVEGEPLAAVKVGGKWGYVDSTGKLAIEPQFDRADIFSDGLAHVEIAGDDSEKFSGFIDPKGRRSINIPKNGFARSFSEGLSAEFIPDGAGDVRSGYIDKTGTFVIQPQFGFATPFSEGLALVATGSGSYGYIDKGGRMAINPQFDGGFPFSEGLAAVKIRGMYGYIDSTGDMVIAPQFELGGQFSEGVAFVKIGGKIGYIDKKGQFLINPKFNDVSGSFSEDMVAVKIGSKWGYIDKVGKVVISPRFNHANSFVDGLAVVKVGGKYGYIDKTGTLLISPQFDNAYGFSEGFAPVKIGVKWGYIDKAGKIVIKPQFDDASVFFQSAKSMKPVM